MRTIITSERRRLGQKLHRALQKYIAVLQVSIANNLAYIMEVVFRAFSLIVLVFVLGQLWKTTFAVREQRF